MTQDTKYLFHNVSEREVEILQQISISTFRATYEHLNDPSNFKLHLEKAFNLRQLKTEIQDVDTYFYFIKSVNKIVGYYKLTINSSQTEVVPNEYAEIERIYVINDFKGQGIGRMMIDHGKRLALILDKKVLWLGVWTENPGAIVFYEKMGFRITGKHHFMLGTDQQTDHVMEVRIQ